MPRRNSACASRPARIELPVMIGTIAAPIDPPTSSPPSRARRRNSARSVVDAADPLRLALQEFDSGERRRRGRRRHADREYKARRHPLQIVDQLGSSGDIAAAGNQALAERPHPDVDLARVDPGPVGRTEPARPEHPQSMRLVDHQPGPVAPRDGDEGRRDRGRRRPCCNALR